MATNKISALLAALLLASSLLAAEVLRAEHFPEGKKLASEKAIPHVVLVHGASWQTLSASFLELIWNAPDLTRVLDRPAVLTDISFPQNPDQVEDKAFRNTHAGWDPNSVASFPALQIYSASGHLLLNIQGRTMRELTTPAGQFTVYLNSALAATFEREKLLSELETSDATRSAELLDRLFALPFVHDPAILLRHDPEDRAGHLARINFPHWRYIGETVSNIREGKAAEALTDTERRLASGHPTPPQRALILGARGIALQSLGRTGEAWESFKAAREAAPGSPEAIAILSHGWRIAGHTFREQPPPDSPLHTLDIGVNLTRDHATFTPSSTFKNYHENHHSLFTGPHTPNTCAFHTEKETDAHILIDLAAICELRALRVTNRTNNQERAATLHLWTSEDGETWQMRWVAGHVAAAWDIPFDPPVRARYMKLGLQSEVPEYLHLLAVDAFGIRGND